LKISQKGWSERVEKQVVKLAVRGSYGEAVKTYSELVGLALVKTTGWERTQERGEQLRKRRLAEAEKEWALPKRQALLPGEVLEPVHKAVSLDGVLVYILNEGWKEVKVGCVFEYATRSVYDRKRDETKEVVKGTAQSYTAYLGGPEVFGQLLSAEAERRGFQRAEKRAGIADGAKWIWNLVGLCFPVVQEIVDWDHATGHVWAAAHLAYGEGTARAKHWATQRTDELWRGEVHKVIEAIETLCDLLPAQAEALRTEAGYFRNNAHRMQYQEFREESYPIGSGTVESGCKRLVETRMRGAGMRWANSGAQNMLALRTEYLSDRWDEAWQLTLAA
jgi:hypothetical protein